MARKPQPGWYEGASVSPSAAATLTHASLFSCYHMLLDWRAANGQGYVEWWALDATRPATRVAWAAAWGTLGVLDSEYYWQGQSGGGIS